MMKKKGPSFVTRVLVVLMVIVIGFASGSSLTLLYARHHHHKIAGVDYPYDASAYYDPVRVSQADSAPSSYALKDLAANGGSVFDLTRYVKSQVEYANLPPWLDKLLQKLGLDTSKYKKSSQQQKDVFAMDLDNIGMSLEHNNAVSDFMDYTDLTPNSEDGYVNTDFKKELTAIDKSYSESSEAIAQADRNRAYYEQAMQRAVEAALNAEGERQVQDARQQAMAIIAAQEANLAAYQQARQRMSEADNRVDDMYDKMNTEAIEHSNQLILDPGDPHDKQIIDSMAEKSGMKPYESIGMPDFK